MARADKRNPPRYVSFVHQGIDYVVDIANHEVLRNWVSIERKQVPEILRACTQANPELVTA